MVWAFFAGNDYDEMGRMAQMKRNIALKTYAERDMLLACIRLDTGGESIVKQRFGQAFSSTSYPEGILRPWVLSYPSEPSAQEAQR